MKIVTMTIEQPNKDFTRYGFDECKRIFFETPFTFLPVLRGYTGAYGWLNDTYMGPQKHLDAYYLTERRCHLGDNKKGVLCGALYRKNGDHKMIVMDYTIMDRMQKYDLAHLPKEWFKQLQNVFGNLSKDERWLNAKEANDLLEGYLASLQDGGIKLLHTSEKDPLLVLHKLENPHL